MKKKRCYLLIGLGLAAAVLLDRGWSRRGGGERGRPCGGRIV